MYCVSRIRTVRLSADLSQAELSRLSGIAQESISRLESGRDYARGRPLGRPKIDTLQRLAGPLGCRWWELLEEKDLDSLRAELREDLDSVTARMAGAGIGASEVHSRVDAAYADVNY